MAGTTPTYHLVSNWETSPSEIVLGSIVVNIKTPDRTLSAPSLPQHIASSVTQTTLSDNVSGIAKQSKTWGAGLFATFLHAVTLGVKIDVNSESASNIEYACSRMETRKFIPTTEYLDIAIEDPSVKHHLEVGGWGSKVFMVTGVKVAQDIKITTIETASAGGEGNIGADISPAQMTVGPKGSYRSTAHDEHSQHIPGPIVFAIQFEKLRLTRRKKQLKHEQHVPGAMLGETKLAEDSFLETAGDSLDDVEAEDFDLTQLHGFDDELKEEIIIVTQ